jgi:predicted metal-dependent phosphoesterase TrpH
MAALLGPEDGVDLHLHTTAHDGRWTPRGLVKHAATHGIRCVAITDHDTVAAVPAARAAGDEHGVLVVPGVEVTSLWRGAICHILLYGRGVETPATPLARLLGGIQDRLGQQARAWVEELESRGQLLPSLDAVRRGRDLLPVYVMGAVIRDGHAPDFATCLRLMGTMEGGVEPAAPLREVVAAAHDAGAVALVAHPGRNEHGFTTLTHAALEEMLGEVPLDGIEVDHPNHTPGLRAYYQELADKRGLLVSAGSDSHGPAHARAPASHAARRCWALLERCLPAGSLRLTADVARIAPPAVQRPGSARDTIV